MADFLSNLPSLGTHFFDGVRIGKIFSGNENSASINSVQAYTTTSMAYGYTKGAPGVALSPCYVYTIAPYSNVITAASGSTPAVYAYDLCPSYNGLGYLPLSVNSARGYSYASVSNNTVIKLDFPRNIQVKRAGTTSGHLAVWGYDYGGVPMAERIELGTSTTAYGKKSFAYVYKIWSSITDTNWQVGVGSIFGLPYYIEAWADLMFFTYNNNLVTYSSSQAPLNIPNFTPGDTTNPATSTTGDTRGTIYVGDMPVYASGPPSAVLFVEMYVQGAEGEVQMVEKLVGVPQFSTSLA